MSDQSILPSELASLIVDEEGEERAAARLEQRLAARGVTQISITLGPVERPVELAYFGPRYRGTTTIDHRKEKPIATALDRLLDELTHVDTFMRLRLAADDMKHVAAAARELAEHRHEIGTTKPVSHNPYALVEYVLEAGLVTVYARSFTGGAALPKKWRPPEGTDDRTLHEALMAARHTIHAHADHTPHRGLADTTALLGQEGDRVLEVSHTRMSASVLQRVALVCDRQRERLEEEALRLFSGLKGIIRPPDEFL